jgi:SAM-dependent methyltransferase
MRLTNIPFTLRHSVANRGFVGTVTEFSSKIVNRLRKSATRDKHALLFHSFDAEFGTDTGGFIHAAELHDGNGNKSIYNTGYFATSPFLVAQALGRLDIDFSRFTFIDLGAGKGRVLLLVSHYPFRQVIGVEYAQALAAAATDNISRYHPVSRKCADVRCIGGDACDFAFPAGPLVIFMWNPFVGPVFDRVVSNLEESLRREPREVYVLYLKPDCAQRLDASPWLEKLWESRFQMTEEDVASGQSAVCAAYRSSMKSSSAAPVPH